MMRQTDAARAEKVEKEKERGARGQSSRRSKVSIHGADRGFAVLFWGSVFLTKSQPSSFCSLDTHASIDLPSQRSQP
jgi:hypothetical protein